MVENNKFEWNHIYYKGEKYEEFDDKIFKYSEVKFEDSSIEPGTKMSKLTLDSFLYRKDTGNETYDFEKTLLYSYLNKVMTKKLRVGKVRIPKLDGITLFVRSAQNEGVIFDYCDYKGWKDKLKFSDSDISTYVHSILKKPSLRYTSNLIASDIYSLQSNYHSGARVFTKTTATVIESGTGGKLGTVGILQSGYIYIYGLVGESYSTLATLQYNIIIEE